MKRYLDKTSSVGRIPVSSVIEDVTQVQDSVQC